MEKELEAKRGEIIDIENDLKQYLGYLSRWQSRCDTINDLKNETNGMSLPLDFDRGEIIKSINKLKQARDELASLSEIQKRIDDEYQHLNVNEYREKYSEANKLIDLLAEYERTVEERNNKEQNVKRIKGVALQSTADIIKDLPSIIGEYITKSLNSYGEAQIGAIDYMADIDMKNIVEQIIKLSIEIDKEREMAEKEKNGEVEENKTEKQVESQDDKKNNSIKDMNREIKDKKRAIRKSKKDYKIDSETARKKLSVRKNIEQKRDNLTTKKKNLEEKSRSLNLEIKKFNDDLAAIQKAKNDTENLTDKEEIQKTLERKKNKINTDLGNSNAELANIDAELANINAELANINAELASINFEIAKARAGSQRADQDIHNAKYKINELKESKTASREDKKVNKDYIKQQNKSNKVAIKSAKNRIKNARQGNGEISKDTEVKNDSKVQPNATIDSDTEFIVDVINRTRAIGKVDKDVSSLEIVESLEKDIEEYENLQETFKERRNEITTKKLKRDAKRAVDRFNRRALRYVEEARNKVEADRDRLSIIVEQIEEVIGKDK